MVRARTPRCSSSSPRRTRRARTSGTPAGGRRSPTPSTWRCATASAWSTSPRSTSSTSRVPVRSPGCSTSRQHVDVAVGRSVYTPLLTPDGGFRGDLTIQRLGDDHFRVITGAFDGGRDQYWFRKHLPTRRIGDVHRPHVQASARSGCGAQTPRRCWRRSTHAMHIDAVDDVSQAGFPYGSVREVLIDGIPCTHVPHLLRRRERLGDLHQHRARPAPVGHRRRRRRRSSGSCRSASACTPSPVASRRAIA